MEKILAENAKASACEMHLVFAVWMLPLTVLQALFGVDAMNHDACLIYIKLLPVFFTVDLAQASFCGVVLR